MDSIVACMHQTHTLTGTDLYNLLTIVLESSSGDSLRLVLLVSET